MLVEVIFQPVASPVLIPAGDQIGRPGITQSRPGPVSAPLARRLLETTQFPVAEIAGRSGFGEVSVFRRHFTSQVGVSPATYRQRFGR